VRFAFKPAGQRGQVWRDKPDGLSSEAANRTLIATMARWVMVGWRFVVVDLDAELSGVAKERLEFDRYRRVISAGESRCRKRGRRRGGEELNKKRKGDDQRCERRPQPRRAKLCATRSPLSLDATPVHETRFFVQNKTLAER
jgi:hypothetical protein